MKLGFMTIAKVYRKKDVQEITDRATGRVTGEYYPVILDDGEDTLDATVPKDVYNGIEEDKIYLFSGSYDDRFKRENTTPKPRITAVLYPINEPWRKDFIDEFSKQTYDSFTILAAEGNVAVTMNEEIKTAITTACQSAVDVCKDGIVAVLPIGLSLMAITMGIRMAVGFFRSLAN